MNFLLFLSFFSSNSKQKDEDKSGAQKESEEKNNDQKNNSETKENPKTILEKLLGISDSF